MSNTDFSISPLCLLPGSPDSATSRRGAAQDTLDRTYQALAAIGQSLKTDEEYGQYLLLLTIENAIRHAETLLFGDPPIVAPADSDTTTPAPGGDHMLLIELTDDEATQLDILSDRAGFRSMNEFAADLIRQALATAGRETPR